MKLVLAKLRLLLVLLLLLLPEIIGSTKSNLSYEVEILNTYYLHLFSSFFVHKYRKGAAPS